MIDSHTLEDFMKDFTKNEVIISLYQMKGTNSHSPNGLSTYFYQHYWNIIGNDITNLALNILNNNSNVANLNQTYICCITKIRNHVYLMIIAL